MSSILQDIKSLLTVEDYDGFDTDLVIHINTALAILKQLGVGPEKGFRITDEKAVWSDYLPEGEELDMAKDYIYLKCRLIFDPPTSGILMQSLKETISELEQRLFVVADPIRLDGMKKPVYIDAVDIDDIKDLWSDDSGGENTDA